MSEYLEERDEKGFTLIELLIAIVVVGVLTAVAIVGIAGLTDKGEKSACQASVDAAKAAQAVHYANTDGTYPTSVNQMVTAGELDLASGVTPEGNGMKNGTKWVVTVSGGGANPLTFAGCPT
jgi:prepilin-type N-terminal cleavage/methylation domain-containing protein